MTSPRRILTTLVGSMPRPADLLDLMKARIDGQVYDPEQLESRIRTAVEDVVRRQAEAGVDVVCDGEMSKSGFTNYVKERLDGFAAKPGAHERPFAAESRAFPEYYESYFASTFDSAIQALAPLTCVAPVGYRGQEALRRDLDNLKAAASKAPHVDVFVPSSAPSGIGANDYYASEEEYRFAVAEAIRTEYRAIIDAGFLLQVDEPFVPDVMVRPDLDDRQRRRTAEMYVAAINHALEGLPPERIRLHTCYGINDGPRIHEANLADFVDIMLQANARYFSYEAANCRHEHEYHLWETVKLPDDKVLIPGVVTHAGNTPEHPELVAERILRFANLVGPDRVMAAPDCGFSSQACYHTEVHPTVIWLRIKHMVEGARIASHKLWKDADVA
jgi:5-methyltetrahydropteroyltriglutamate--homocysteine methyltransferase